MFVWFCSEQVSTSQLCHPSNYETGNTLQQFYKENVHFNYVFPTSQHSDASDSLTFLRIQKPE